MTHDLKVFLGFNGNKPVYIFTLNTGFATHETLRRYCNHIVAIATLEFAKVCIYFK